jgi:hypothetical protein
MYKQYWLENLKEKDHLEALAVNEKILQWILKK